MANYQNVYFLLISPSCYRAQTPPISSAPTSRQKHISGNFYSVSFSSIFCHSHNHTCSVEVCRLEAESNTKDTLPLLLVPDKTKFSEEYFPTKTRHLAGYRSKSDFAKPGILSQMQNHPEKSHPKSSRRLATHAYSVIAKKKEKKKKQ